MKYRVIFLLLLLGSAKLSAQNFPGSPYTYFGLGDIFHKGFGSQLMVGGTGIADRGPYSLNNLNPASYSSIDYPYTSIAEIGLGIALAIRESEDSPGFQADAQLPFLSLGFKTGASSGASFGLRQFSNVEYSIIGTDDFTGLTDEYLVRYEGEGGLNELYLGWGKKFSKRFSAGLHGSFLFGQLQNDQNIISQVGSYNLTIQDKTFLTGFKADFGVQYHLPLERSHFQFGATYNLASDLNANRDVTIINQVTTTTGPRLDTVTEESVDSRADYVLPHGLGLGASWILPAKMKVSADYSVQLWSNTGTDGDNFDTRNSTRLSTGVQTLPDYTNFSFLRRISWGLGFYYEQSYLDLGEASVNTRGFTAGFSYPVGKNRGIIRFIAENASRGESFDDYFKDNFTKFTISFSLLEVWFRKPAYD